MLSDTHPDAERVPVELLRRFSPASMYLEPWAGEPGVADLLARALAEAEICHITG
jgi:hypothetical protein